MNENRAAKPSLHENTIQNEGNKMIDDRLHPRLTTTVAGAG
jgi:hypothetical protein